MAKTPLSASRIKTLQNCSWQYFCNYLLRFPQTDNEGSLRGNCVHQVFECLGNPRHKHLYDKAIKEGCFKVPAIKKMVMKFCTKKGIDDPANLALVENMIQAGLEYDFFGEDYGKVTKGTSEESFDITKEEDGKNYRVRGFIDKIFLYKKGTEALIRDFKSSKSVFEGKDITSNLQDFIYRIALKHLYPEVVKERMQFLFLRFDCTSSDGDGVLDMGEISQEEMDGFEDFLTEIQQIIDNFDENQARKGFAYDKGFVEGFAGRTMCGRADNPDEKKVDGTPKWKCPYKFAQVFYRLKDKEGNIISSSYNKDDLKETEDLKIEEFFYEGCPKFGWMPYNRDAARKYYMIEEEELDLDDVF